MKKIMMKYISVILASIIFLSTIPQPVEAASKIYSGKYGENIKWTYDKKTATLTISGKGKMQESAGCEDHDPDWWAWNDETKTLIIEDGVTTIANDAFYYFISLEKVIIADSVIEIGAYSFDACKSLKNIKLPNKLKKIGDEAFTLTLLEEIKIPDTVTYIGTDVFYLCENLKKVKLSKSIKKIYSGTFWCCASLKQIEIPYNVQILSSSIFAASGLTSVIIPENVTEIKTKAFDGCEQLKKITIKSKKLKIIKKDAFRNIEKNATIILPKSKYKEYKKMIEESGIGEGVKFVKE